MKSQRTRVKICGITRLEDALLADTLGVDALGFVFVPASARHLSVGAAADIIEHVSPFVTIVGLFLNAPREQVHDALDKIPSMLPHCWTVTSQAPWVARGILLTGRG